MKKETYRGILLMSSSWIWHDRKLLFKNITTGCADFSYFMKRGSMHSIHIFILQNIAPELNLSIEPNELNIFQEIGS